MNRGVMLPCPPGLEVYASVGAMVRYRLRTGNRFPPMKHEVAEVLYICLAIKRSLLFYPKSSFGKNRGNRSSVPQPFYL